MLQCCGQPSVTGFWDQHGQGLRGIFTGVRVSWSHLLALRLPAVLSLPLQPYESALSSPEMMQDQKCQVLQREAWLCAITQENSCYRCCKGEPELEHSPELQLIPMVILP